MNYQETIQYLYDRLPVFHIIGSSAYKPGLDNTIRLMELLDNPHKKFKSIHVAGTNGKGSVSHYIAAILQQSGYKVGLYTSPHLVDFGERIRISGKMIDQNYVVDFIEKNISIIETVQPSFFELTMAMGFSYFADRKVDIAVIEVGLGGRLDSTNIINPELSIITNIGFDHVEFLGNTLEKIATEKAGIIKLHVPVIVGETVPETKAVFVQKAKEMDADIYFASKKKALNFVEYRDNKMLVLSDNQLYVSELCGRYQLKNMATVLTAIEVLNSTSTFLITSESIKAGLEKVCSITGLRGRWEIIRLNPMIVADTGHNVHGMQEVANQLKCQIYSNLRIVIGMVNDKDISGVLKLLPGDAIYYFTKAQVKRALDAQELKKTAAAFQLFGNSYDLVQNAIENCISESDPKDLILITGSNFVVGEALTLFNEE
ncbi:MAG: folylpolyglutamate synthase/dihydrofolate synthase family protein [Paludibacter sp.]|nr:folylpolyglutamate synthase/dihydrofolate synthase family protein [Paludibacter sp.]